MTAVLEKNISVKTCKKCGKEKVLGDFYFEKTRNRYKPVCKSCYPRSNNKKTPEQRAEYRRKHNPCMRQYRSRASINEDANTKRELNRILKEDRAKKMKDEKEKLNAPRSSAKEKGEKKYTCYTPCRKCGAYERYTANNQCVSCAILKYKRRYEVDHEKELNRRQEWRDRNTEYDRAYKTVNNRNRWREKYSGPNSKFRGKDDLF